VIGAVIDLFSATATGGGFVGISKVELTYPRETTATRQPKPMAQGLADFLAEVTDKAFQHSQT